MDRWDSFKLSKLCNLEKGKTGESIKLFGGKRQYLNAVAELEQELYTAA